MTKKSLDRKTVQKFIVASRAKGKLDQEIYNELKELYYDKKSIALLITGTVTAENKKKYKKHNNILLGLLGFVALSKVLAVFFLTITTGNLWILLFVFIVPLFTGWFIYEIYRYNGQMYRIFGMLTIVGFLQTISKADTRADILLNIILGSAIAGLCFYLDSKMFPDYSPKNLKKDSCGEYILS